jgi:hypothetical protein
MVLDIAIVAVLILCAYQLGAARGRHGESRWWTGAVYAAGRGKLDALQAYIAARNPRSSEPHQCPDELAPHLVLPHVGDRGRPIVLPADWAAPIGESAAQHASQSGTGAPEVTRAQKREKAG